MRQTTTVILLFLSAAPSLAQIAPPVAAGSQVRFWAPEGGHKKTRATVLGWHDSMVTFTLPKDRLDVLVPYAGLTKLEVLAGKDRLRGGLMGAALGAAVGALVGGLIGNSAVQGCEGFMCEMEAMNYAAVGMLAGIAIGTPIGIGAAPNKWKRVNLPIEAGFPPYHTPWHQTAAFNVATGIAATLLLIAISGGN